MTQSPVLQMRDPNATAESLRDFLADFPATSARLWAYGVSHRYFQLRVSVSESDYIMISMFGCSFLSGPTDWRDPQLNLSVAVQEDGDQHRWKLWDDRVEFSVNGTHLYWGQLPDRGDFAGWFSPEHPRPEE